MKGRENLTNAEGISTASPDDLYGWLYEEDSTKLDFLEPLEWPRDDVPRFTVNDLDSLISKDRTTLDPLDGQRRYIFVAALTPEEFPVVEILRTSLHDDFWSLPFPTPTLNFVGFDPGLKIWQVIFWFLGSASLNYRMRRRPPPGRRRRSCSSFVNPKDLVISNNFAGRQTERGLDAAQHRLLQNTNIDAYPDLHHILNNSQDLQLDDPSNETITDHSTVPISESKQDVVEPNLLNNPTATPSLTQPSLSTSPNVPTPTGTSTLSHDPLIYCELIGCNRTFTLPNHYNRHKKSHTHPERCSLCNRGFETPKDLRRHHNDVHETTTRFYCSFATCKYAKGRKGNGFPRKDNWRRHLRNKHGEVEGNVRALVMEGED